MTRKRYKSAKRGQPGGARRAKNQARSWLRVGLPILAAVIIGIGGAWWAMEQRAASSAASTVELAPVAQLSDPIRRAPSLVQEAYRFALANPDVVDKLPCYCGCGGMGHDSNLDCFVERFEPGGGVVFGYHALE